MPHCRSRHRRLLLLPAVALALTAAMPLGSAAIAHHHKHAAKHAVTKDATVCKHVPRGRVGCFAIRVDHVHAGRKHHASSPTGYGPDALSSAYSLPSTTKGAGQTVAIVDAYDDPTAAADLSVYRKQFGLPACTTATHCFRKVGQSGTSALPETDGGWAEEISLDLDMVSAVCPKCHILLVEASSPSMKNLGAAEDTAVRLGADAVSNSWGGADATDADYGRYFHHAGVAITASSGDEGYGASYPASSKWVTAVSGTTLKTSSSARGYTESAWSDAGSGCSTKNATTWQTESTTGCAGRAVADVSAVADPSTGVAVYDSDAYDGASGWMTFGGTSASSPIIAATFALAGNTADVDDGSYLWNHHASGLNDILTGSNGSCTTSQWCSARAGWDGPSGWGSPDGTTAF